MTVARRAATAWPCSRPGWRPTSSGRSSPARSSVEVDDDEAQITAGRSQFSLRLIPADEFPRLDRARRRRRHARRRRPRPGAAPGGAGGQHRRLPADPHRRAAGRRGATGCAWWPPTPTGSAVRDLPGAACWARARACCVPSRALGELARLLGGGDEVDAAPRRARRGASSVGRRAAHDPADRGRVPELPGPDPREPPQPALVVSREALLEAVRRVRLHGPRGDAGAPRS